MLAYRPTLKTYSRALRTNQALAEQKLWFHLRRKQLLGVQFYRQKPIGKYIVDFYAPSVSLVIELDGTQHYLGNAGERDQARDSCLNKLGLRVLRFSNRQVFTEIEGVLRAIFQYIESTLNES
ncbi:MAG TPA: endonuclease domain-containing protein [bacterium]|nr:endonuclease domain-containing protein [bacterium]